MVSECITLWFVAAYCPTLPVVLLYSIGLPRPHVRPLPMIYSILHKLIDYGKAVGTEVIAEDQHDWSQQAVNA